MKGESNNYLTELYEVAERVAGSELANDLRQPLPEHCSTFLHTLLSVLGWFAASRFFGVRYNLIPNPSCLVPTVLKCHYV